MDENRNMNGITSSGDAEKRTAVKASAPVRLAVAISAIVIAIVLIFNIFVKQLPTNVLEFDISGNGLYEISETTREFMDTLENDIEIIVIQDNTAIDERLIKFLDRYQTLSDHLKISYIDPVEHPSVLDTYEASDESVVVKCEDTGNQRVININGFDSYEECIFGFDYMYYYYYDTYSLASFDADGQITSAINSVLNTESKMIYYLSGHGESEMNATLEASIYKAGYKTGTVNLLRDGGIPEDCDLLFAHVPTSDLANDEYDMISRYMDAGGKFMLIIDDKALTNFNLLMADFGLQMNDGYLGDTTSYYTAYASSFGYYCIAPTLSEDSPITSDVKQDAMLVYPRGMTRITANRPNVAVENFLTSSPNGICYYDDDNKKEGIFAVGSVSTQTLENGGTARMTTISAQYIVEEELLGTTSNMSNLTIVLNAVIANFGDVSTALAIPSKTITLSYNNSVNTPLWDALFIAVIPLAFIIGGLACWNARRKR